MHEEMDQQETMLIFQFHREMITTIEEMHKKHNL
jgi:hypothetical protein